MVDGYEHAAVIASAKPRVRSYQPSKDIGTQLRLSGFGHGKDEKVLTSRSDHFSKKSALYEDTWLSENDQTHRPGWVPTFFYRAYWPSPLTSTSSAQKNFSPHKIPRL